jgi:hypothetical protein
MEIPGLSRGRYRSHDKDTRFCHMMYIPDVSYLKDVRCIYWETPTK